MVLAAVAPSGCGGSEALQQQVTELRVLGVQREPPDAAPGQQVALSALVVDPLPGESTLTWCACATPISAGEYFSGGLDTSVGLCADPDLPFGQEIGAGPTASFTVPETFLDDVVDELVDQGWQDEDGEPYLPLWVVVRDGRGGTSWCEQRLPHSSEE